MSENQSVTTHKLSDTTISHGGLMRCCLATIAELPDTEYADETIIDCKHEGVGNKNIILKNGVWQWNNQ
jgi:hypothetical protein